MDKLGFYRVGGRFGNYSNRFNRNYPLLLLLRSDGLFTNLIIFEAHNIVNHMGVASTLSEIFWICKGTQIIKRHLMKCVICKRNQGKVLKGPEAPDLPKCRVSTKFVFQTTGLDFAEKYSIGLSFWTLISIPVQVLVISFSTSNYISENRDESYLIIIYTNFCDFHDSCIKMTLKI